MEIPDHITKLEDVGNIVSLYSGAGGLDIGFHLAGFNTIWANDIDKNATRTYENIFPTHKITTGDLLDQNLPYIPNIDLVIGGPPCQGFSIAGKMDPHDPRSKHVWNFMAIVSRISPRGFVMENVKSLAENSRWQTLRDDLIKESHKMGYTPKIIILNASHFGVPQARERMFLIGLKKVKFCNPVAVTVQSPIFLRDSLKKLPKYGEAGNNSICIAKITPAKRPILRKSPYAGMLFNGQGRPLDLNRPAPTLPASMGGNRTPIIDQKELDLGNKKKNSWIVKYHKYLMKGGIPHNEVPNSLRRITVEEAAAIQTFPLGMKFYGAQTAQYRQIGNAVPPMLAYHVALAVRKSLYGNK